MRSLASETARQASRAPRSWRLQWYAADFQEERSALDGGLLVRNVHMMLIMYNAQRQCGCVSACPWPSHAPFRVGLRLACGCTQEHQTAFAVDCLRWLRQQHGVRASADTPWRVIVVGHSMGGIVARAAIALSVADSTFGELGRSTCAPNVHHVQVAVCLSVGTAASDAHEWSQ